MPTRSLLRPTTALLALLAACEPDSGRSGAPDAATPLDAGNACHPRQVVDTPDIGGTFAVTDAFVYVGRFSGSIGKYDRATGELPARGPQGS